MQSNAGGTGSAPGSGVTVGGGQLSLKAVVEQLVPMKAQEREELSRPLQPLHDPLLS